MDALAEIRKIDPRDLVGARQLAHQAAQWLTRAAIAALPPEPGDSHTNVGWDQDLEALVTHPLDEGGAALGLRLGRLELLRLRQGHLEASFALEDQRDGAAGDWVAEQLATLGVPEDPRRVALPYEIPSHPVAKGAPYDAAGERDTLRALAAWYALAAALLEETRLANLGLRPGPSDVRCWPHHFDIATLILLEAGDPETVPQIGVGLSPGDETLAEPYFYVTPWPAPDDLPPLPEPGTWHREGFVGALAPASRILEQDDPAAAVRVYLKTTVSFSREALPKSPPSP